MIGRKLRELLKLRNIKQIKLAKHLGISASRLSNYLSDKREPDLDMLAKMAKFLSVDLNYFTDVRFSAKKESSYGIQPVEELVAMEATPQYNVDSDMVDIPYLTINAKKRALRNKTLPLSKMFLSGVDDPSDNVVLFEVTTGIGGDMFSPGDFILAARFESFDIKNGTTVFETGRNGKCYKYIEDKDTKFLLSDSQEVLHLSEIVDLSSFYAVLWLFKKPY